METSSTREMEELIARLQVLKKNIPQNESLRKELYSTLQALSYALERPIDTVKRISYLPIQLACSKIAIDLRIFEILSSRESPITTLELAAETKADPVLLKRILQYLASVGMVNRNGDDAFSSSNITRTLSIPGFQAGIKHHYEVHLPAWAALAGFLAEMSYKNPSDDKHTPFQLAHHTNLPAYQWALGQPRLFQDFNHWMVAQRTGEKTWLDVVPKEYITKDPNSATPLFVDIGGGVGHQCAALLAAFPQIRRKVVLQDLASPIAHALPTPGVEAMVHNFWEDQPIKDASIYYLRNVLHNYPDNKCIELLQKTIQALSPSSIILIDEIVLANGSAHWQAAQLDITMMASLGAMERSHAQWVSLLDAAGLIVENIFSYTEEAAESLIVAVMKSAV